MNETLTYPDPRRSLRAQKAYLSLLSLVMVALPACGGKIAPPLECGTGSDIVFGYQIAAQEEHVDLGQMVLWENGTEFLFIDSSCNYWAYYWTDEHLLWSDIRHGRLTKEQLARVNRELIERDWDEIASTPAPPSQVSHPGGAFLWNGDKVGFCYKPCTSALEPLLQTTGKITRELFASGAAPSDMAAMRWIVLDNPLLVRDAFHFEEWHGGALSEVAFLTEEPDGYPDDYAALRFGGHPFVPDTDVPLLRSLRNQYRNKTFDSFSSSYLTLTDEGRTYQVYARDVLPFEDAEGLVRPPGYASK
jgi:hypothetical protein